MKSVDEIANLPNLIIQENTEAGENDPIPDKQIIGQMSIEDYLRDGRNAM